eukprot:6422867-Pyramimonas_sp.AAC.1
MLIPHTSSELNCLCVLATIATVVHGQLEGELNAVSNIHHVTVTYGTPPRIPVPTLNAMHAHYTHYNCNFTLRTSHFTPPVRQFCTPTTAAECGRSRCRRRTKQPLNLVVFIIHYVQVVANRSRDETEASDRRVDV